MTQGEIVIYQENNKANFQIEVRIEDETVWLNRQQIASLFDRDVKTIGKHIANALKEELKAISVVAKFATTASDGKKYQIEHYNLDMIISIGYRVKSQRGVSFRIWANKILKDYLLKGYSINKRLENVESDIYDLKRKTQELDFHVKTNLPPHEGVFFDGQIFDAYVFVADIIKSAKSSIILIDNYVDETVLTLLSKRNSNAKATIYTKQISSQLQLDLQKHNAQYPPIEIKTFADSHDRFLLIDKTELYHIGASLKDLGKKWFAFSKMDSFVKSVLEKVEN